MVHPQLHSKLNWEHQIENMKFIDFSIVRKLMSGNEQYYLFYWGTDVDKIDTIDGKIYGRYPALMSFDKDGNLLFRKEEPIPLLDSLKANGYISTGNLSEFFFTGGRINLVIPEGFFPTYSPNFFRFSSMDGNLNTIDGYESGLYQLSSLEAIINNNDLFVLSAFSLNSIDEASINVHSLDVVNNYTLKYRIWLNHAPFTDSIINDYDPTNLIFCDDSTFFVFYLAKDYKSNIVAKYSYNRDSANAFTNYNSNINSNLLNYTVYKAKSNEVIRKAYKLHNGNYLAMHYSGGFVILNENAEIIYNDLPFANSSYDNFSLAFVLPLKKKPGYYALYGNYNDNGNRNFAIVITDSLWNKVDKFVWDYGDNYNLLEDMVEGDDGNLIVYGSTRYKIDNKVVFKSYYASVHFDFLTGVEDKNNLSNDIIIQPNPATDYITINLGSIGASSNENNIWASPNASIQIYDVMGVLVAQTSSSVFNGQTGTSDPPRIDISNLSPGVYFVKIVGSNGACSIVEKFVKY